MFQVNYIWWLQMTKTKKKRFTEKYGKFLFNRDGVWILGEIFFFLYTHSNHIWSLALLSCFKCSDDKLWNLLNRSWGRGWGFVLGWVSGLIRPYIEHVFLLEVVVVCHPLTISFLKLRGILSPGNIEWNMCSVFRNLF